MKLFLKYSNLCDHWSRYLNVTDRQTGRQTTYCGTTVLCVVSRGNKTTNKQHPRLVILERICWNCISVPCPVSDNWAFADCSKSLQALVVETNDWLNDSAAYLTHTCLAADEGKLKSITDKSVITFNAVISSYICVSLHSSMKVSYTNTKFTLARLRTINHLLHCTKNIICIQIRHICTMLSTNILLVPRFTLQLQSYKKTTIMIKLIIVMFIRWCHASSANA